MHDWGEFCPLGQTRVGQGRRCRGGAKPKVGPTSEQAVESEGKCRHLGSKETGEGR